MDVPKTNRGMPLPPGFEPEAQLAPPQMPPPPMPEIEVGQGAHSSKLSEDESSLILRTTLLPEHASDPNIIRFISHYMRCRDASQAAQEAGLTRKSGKSLLLRRDIYDCIRKLTDKAVIKYGFDADELIEKVKEITYFDPIELENDDGTFKKHMKDIAPEARRVLKKLKVKNTFETDPNGMKIWTGEIIEYEFYDKIKGVELLGREKDLFKETKKVQHDVTANMKDVLLASRDRAEQRVIDVTPAKQIEAPRGSADE
jgi:hypothetical protein